MRANEDHDPLPTNTKSANAGPRAFKKENKQWAKCMVASNLTLA
jgi:hypothetical protein